MMVDVAILAYRNLLRMQGWVGNLCLLVEGELFGQASLCEIHGPRIGKGAKEKPPPSGRACAAAGALPSDDGAELCASGGTSRQGRKDRSNSGSGGTGECGLRRLKRNRSLDLAGLPSRSCCQLRNSDRVPAVKGNRGYGGPVAAVIRELTAAKLVARPRPRLPGLRRLGHLDQQAGLHVMDIAVDGYAGGDEWVGMERSAHAAKSVHALLHRDRT